MELDNIDYLDLEEPLKMLIKAKRTALNTHLLLKTGPQALDNQRLHQDMGFVKNFQGTSNSSLLHERQYCIWAPTCLEGGVLKIQDHTATEPCYIVVPLGSVIVFDGAFKHAGVSWNYGKDAMTAAATGRTMVDLSPIVIDDDEDGPKKKPRLKENIGVCTGGYYFY